MDQAAADPVREMVKDRLYAVPCHGEMSSHHPLHLEEAKAYVQVLQEMSAQGRALEKRPGIGRSWTG